jgi:hypothetical protein
VKGGALPRKEPAAVAQIAAACCCEHSSYGRVAGGASMVAGGDHGEVRGSPPVGYSYCGHYSCGGGGVWREGRDGTNRRAWGRGSLARRYRVGVILRKNEMRKVSGGRFIVNLPHQLNPANLLQNLKAKPGKFGGRIKDKITLQSCKKFPALCHSRPQLVRIERHLSLKQL